MESSGHKKFQNGKIYIIGNYIDDATYVGQTTQSLTKRFYNHMKSINASNKNTTRLCQKMIQLGIEHFYIEEIEKCPCDNIEELKKRERHYIRELQPVLQIPLRQVEEWRDDTEKQYRKEETTPSRKQSKVK